MAVAAQYNAPVRIADGSMYLGDMDEIYTRLHAEAPVFWDDEQQVWVLSKWADVRDAVRDPQAFTSEKGSHFFPFDDRTSEGRAPDANVLYMDPPKHTVYRKLIMSALTPRLIKSIEPRIRRLVVEHLDEFQPGQPVDFVSAVSIPIPLLVITDLLGLPIEDRELYLRWADAFGGSHVTGSDAGERNATIAQMTQYMDDVLKQRLQNPTDDLLSALAFASEDGDKLDYAEVIQIAVLMLAAGNDTTRNLLSGGVRALLQWPDERAKLAADPDLMPGTVEEMLRYVSPVRYFGRVATRDVEIRGHTIRADDAIVPYYAAANRDPEIYPDPHRFDVERRMDRSPHVAFSYGTHFCAGARLARQEAHVVFDELLKRFPNYEQAGEIELEPNVMLNATLALPILPA